MSEFEARVLSDLSVLKSQMNRLMGIGEPGVLAALEERVAGHEVSIQRLRGVAAAFGVGLTAIHIAIDFVRRHI